MYSERNYNKTWTQILKDFIGIPLRFTLPHNFLNKVGLTSLKQERINIALKYAKGKLLDIGCGENNELAIQYRRSGNIGIGADVHPWPKADVICDTENLPYPNQTFDTISIIAVLNHIPNRKQVLAECSRVLKKDGIILISYLNPLISLIRHKLIFWWDKDQKERGMKKGEKYGLSKKEIKRLLADAGFEYQKNKKFVYGLNNLIVGRKNCYHE